MSIAGKYVDLNYIVNSVMNQIDSDDRDYARLYQIGVTGLRELWFDVAGNVKTVLLPKNANNTVTLPTDYINWSKVGILTQDGKVFTLALNKSITLYNDTNTNRVVSPGSFIEGGLFKIDSPDYHNYWTEGMNYNLFGLGGSVADVAQFNIDEENGLIVLGSEFKRSDVILEYVVDPLACECDTHSIHIFCQQALEDYIYWKAVSKRKDTPANEKMRARQEYYNQKRVARNRMKPFRIGDAYDTSRRSVYMAPKL
jgi:hypothetical protein